VLFASWGLGRTVVEGRGPVLIRVAAALGEHGLEPADLRVEQPTLEDAFLALVGRRTEEWAVRALVKLSWVELKLFARGRAGARGPAAACPADRTPT
jgi:hypothetical protein